jgi:hypothetical protein
MLCPFVVNYVRFYGELGIHVQVFLDILILIFDESFLIGNSNLCSIDIFISNKEQLVFPLSL